jgi:hypothetical protein
MKTETAADAKNREKNLKCNRMKTETAADAKNRRKKI